MLTILQTQDSLPVVLTKSQSKNLQQLYALEIQGHVASQSLRFSIGNDALNPLWKLQYLKLTGVNLSSDHIGLSKLNSLRYLCLQQNNMKVLSKTFLTGMLTLEELTIAHNHLQDIPPLAFVDLPSLKRLNLNDNHLQYLDANSFVNLEELEVLDLSSNNISDVSFISFPPLPKLLWLHLQNNPIKVIFLNAFHFLNHTSILSVGHKQQSLHIMKYSFTGLNSLKSLSLPNLDNQILEKDMFHGLTSLQSLSLRGQIKTITSGTFSNMPQLQHLTLHHCQLRTLPIDAFQGLKHLHSLDLSGNMIAKLPIGIFDPVKGVKELELQNNNLHHLSSQVFAQLQLQMLRLDDNPWHCSCAMAKWNRTAIGYFKKVTYKKCHNSKKIAATVLGLTETNSLVNELPPPSSSSSVSQGCQRMHIQYIHNSLLRPVCQTPVEFKGKKVFDVLRKELKCSNGKNVSNV